MNWLQEQTTLLPNHSYNTGKPRTLRQVLMCDFARDINTLVALYKLDRQAPDYTKKKKELKAKLQCWTPSSLLESRAKDNVIITSRTHLLQLDFDHEQIKDYNIEELKQAVFALPFIAFCSLSCSGDGFFALAAIAEPERLKEYAEHCFTIFIDEYGIAPDTTKGMNAHDLRYCSYDGNMLWREKPQLLQIKQFRQKQKPVQPPKRRTYSPTDGATTQQRVERLINELSQSNVDITSGYNNWLSIGFALADEFGEMGRGYFHDASSMNAGYNARQCDNQYTKCLRSKRQGITIKTFFHACKEAGILIKSTQQ